MKFFCPCPENSGETGPSAVLALFDGGPSLCLCVRTERSDRFVWLYEDGTVSVQSGGFGNLPPEEIVKKFYEGDSITLTF